MSVSFPGNSRKFSSQNRITRDITKSERTSLKSTQYSKKTGAIEQTFAKIIRHNTEYQKLSKILRGSTK